MPRQSTHETKPKPEKSPRREPTASGQRDAAVNRIASHNYFLLEKFECGVVLTGTEAKSVRGGLANLKDSYGLVKDGELWLLNAHIGPYEHGNIHNHAPLRTRKLLMHKEEIRKLIGKTQQKGLTLIPVRMYFKNGRVKVELALAKGKQLWDKRETERRRTADKEAREAIRSRKSIASEGTYFQSSPPGQVGGLHRGRPGRGGTLREKDIRLGNSHRATPSLPDFTTPQA